MDSLLLIGIGLLGLGALLMVLEAFVPSGGVLGLVAVVCAVAGIVFLFKYDVMWGAIGALGTAVFGPMVFFGTLNMLPNTAIGRTMVGDSGEDIAIARAEATHEQRSKRDALMGVEGVALTDMRPSGVVELNGERHDAISQGGIVDIGQRIRVTNVSGLTIEIRAV